MNLITILIWITIALIGIIGIILVKLHYKGDELEADEGSILPSGETINGILSTGKNAITSSKKAFENNRLSNSTRNNTNNYHSLEPQNASRTRDDAYIVPEVENNSYNNYEYESPNQVLVNYGNTVEKFQEPIKQNQMDIMTQNNKDKTELKDLFTIDELIKESKRKDSEREKEAQKINKESEDLTDIKESIKKNQETPSQEPLIEEVIAEEEDVKTEITEKEIPKVETPSVTTQKDIDEAISTASKESETDEVESISESENITDALLNSKEEAPAEEIKEPTLKTPSKVGENKDYKLGASVDNSNLSGDDDTMDLDYRKDLDKFTNKIKESKIFKEVKDKIVQEKEELFDRGDETYIRNVNEYDDFEPIINETHDDFDILYGVDEDDRLRQENTRRVFNMAKKSPEPELAKPLTGSIKDKPARDNIKININNNEVVLKKGDEIIFNHLGETYSSQVYAINGDDISVRYRRKDIKIKPEDVKKIY